MKNLVKWVVVPSVTLILLLLFYILFLNHIDINEVGVAYNSIGGKIWIQDRPGWYLTAPTVEVAVISTLPMKVSIPSEAKVINVKIVKFNPAGIDEFIRLQGFSYFTNQGLENILMGYAFSGGTYSFLDIVQVTGTETIKTTPLKR